MFPFLFILFPELISADVSLVTFGNLILVFDLRC